MLRCDDCETDFNPHFVAEEGNDDGGCPNCGGTLHEPGCDVCGCHFDWCGGCPTVRRILRAPPAAVARFATICK